MPLGALVALSAHIPNDQDSAAGVAARSVGRRIRSADREGPDLEPTQRVMAQPNRDWLAADYCRRGWVKTRPELLAVVNGLVREQLVRRRIHEPDSIVGIEDQDGLRHGVDDRPQL
jgi:hypothetical protein